jgi:hypothetical protein
MTLRQPTFGHGGNARFDEVTMAKPNKVINDRQPVVFDVLADATDEELDELAMVVVAKLDEQAAEHNHDAAPDPESKRKWPT